jgi:hypothetical protein
MARNEVPARVAAGNDQAVLLLVLMLRDTAKGLAALHNQAVVHGDLVRCCYLQRNAVVYWLSKRI